MHMIVEQLSESLRYASVTSLKLMFLFLESFAFIVVQIAKKVEEQAKAAREPPLEKAIIDHFSETLLPGRLLHYVMLSR